MTEEFSTAAESAGRAAYAAYCDAVGGVSVRGEPLPTWEGQSALIRAAWMHAAEAVLDQAGRGQSSTDPVQPGADGVG